MRTLLFRADGDATTGLGHLYRIFALMDMYRKRYECVLLIQNRSRDYIPPDYKWLCLPEGLPIEAEPDWMAANFVASRHWVIADGYFFTSNWQQQLTSKGFRLLYIDDLHAWHMYADVVVNHAAGIKSSEYQTEPHTRLALGPSYAILRAPFLAAATQSRTYTGFSTAFICFGGADPLDLTNRFTRMLLQGGFNGAVEIVLGAAYQHHSIFELAKKHPAIHIHANLGGTELAAVMAKCDFAIAPSSTILYELCAVKMPILGGFYVDNQKYIYEGCVNAGLIYPGGDFRRLTDTDLLETIQLFFKNSEPEKAIKRQAALMDGKTEERFLNLLEPIIYRLAGENDMNQVFEWANDPVSRANSYFSESIPLETHQRWFTNKLKDPKCLLFIAEAETEAAGMVRYETGTEYTTVGILVDKEFRGRGMASRMLVDTAVSYFERTDLPIHAFIKTTNLASVKTFQKAGYRFLKEEIIHGAPSFVYQLKKEHVQ